MSTMGERIRMQRGRLGLTAAELARRAEISKAYLSELENDKVPSVSAAVLYRIASELGCTMESLMGVPVLGGRDVGTVSGPSGRDSMIFDIVRLRAQQAELHERLVRVEGWILNNSQVRLGTRDRARPRE